MDCFVYTMSMLGFHDAFTVLRHLTIHLVSTTKLLFNQTSNRLTLTQQIRESNL
jgi:hypothetical protein